MGMEIVSLYKKNRFRCEVIGCYSNNSTSHSLALIYYPIVNESSHFSTVIPLIFNPTKYIQKATFVSDDEDKSFIEHIIYSKKNGNYRLIYNPIDNVTFEIKISPIGIHTLTSAVLPNISTLDLDLPCSKHVTERIKRILSLDSEEIHIEEYNHIPSRNISQDDLELWTSFTTLFKRLGQTNVIKQDIINALIDLVICKNCTNTLYDIVIKHSIFTKTLSREEREEIHYNVVLSSKDFFDANTTKAAANYFYYKDDFMNAVTLFQKYLNQIIEKEEFKNQLPETYNSIGCCHASLLKFDLAYDAFAKSIKEDPTYSAALNNWAYTLDVESETTSNKQHKLKLLRDALGYINDAIQHSPKEVQYFSNRTYIEYESGDYERVIKDASSGRKLSDNYADYSTMLKLSIEARIKIAIENKKENELRFSDLLDDLMVIFDNETTDSKYYYEALKVYIEASEDHDNELLKNLARDLVLFEFHVRELLDSLAIHNPKQDIYCYTSMRSLQMILSDVKDSVKYRLPLFNVNHMNDPREGKELESLLLEKDCDNQMLYDILNSCANTTNRKRLSADYVFLKSFTQNNDSLPMWIHYADSGKGCCIKISRSFFTNFSSDLTGDDKTFTTNSFNDQCRLYSVLYIKDGKLLNNASSVTEDNFKQFTSYFHTISSYYSKLDSKTQVLVSDAIRKITLRLRYLIKSYDYTYEQEMRIVVNCPITDIKRNACDIKMTPPSDTYPVPKVFIYSSKSLPIEEIILGPKVPETDDLVPFFEKKLLDINDFDMDKALITKSEIKYR